MKHLIQSKQWITEVLIRLRRGVDVAVYLQIAKKGSSGGESASE